MKKSRILKTAVTAASALVLGEIAYKTAKTPIPDLPEKVKSETLSATHQDDVDFVNAYRALKGEYEMSEEKIYAVLKNQTDYVNKRYDCSDFRLPLLFRIYKECTNALSERTKELIKNTFLNFKYFMDEPGDDSMCYWSENHQIEFAVAEYLAGNEWQNAIFTNDGKTGISHKEKASKRIEAWMKQRFCYGFSEYLSNNYLLEDIGPMSSYIAYCDDPKSAERMKIIMDILWLDVALNSVNNRFSAASSRMYGDNKAGNYLGNSILPCMNRLWGEESLKKQKYDTDLARFVLKMPDNSTSVNFTELLNSVKYALPSVIKDIALSDDTFTVKMSSGLSPEDLEEENLVGQSPEQIMAQFGAECFTNPEVIENTAKYIKDNKMTRNLFVYYFKYLDTILLKRLNLRKICEKHELMTHGIALGRGNIYTYRTPDYCLTTLTAKDVDKCGAQEHIWNANIAENLTLFTTHPAREDENGYGSSPGYWIGNGRLPMSVQNKNVNITIYKLPEKRRVPEPRISKMTHAYMPKCFYDEFEHRGNIVFARRNSVYVALVSNGEMKFKPYNEKSAEPFYKTYNEKAHNDAFNITGEFDLCRTGGEYHSYITELSDSSQESFSDFKERILNKPCKFDGGKVKYGDMEVSCDGTYLLNGVAAEKEFKRYDCDYCQSERKGEKITIKRCDKQWILDFGNALRASK